MPFDGVLLDEFKARWRRLINELRQPQPDWDFRTHRTCAIGIARRLFPETGGDVTELASLLGVSATALRHLFISPKPYGHRHMDRVTKDEVARELEKLFQVADGGEGNCERYREQCHR